MLIYLIKFVLTFDQNVYRMLGKVYFHACVCLGTGWGFSMGTEFQFHSWRVFVLVAALPAVASLVGLTFMPESPRFLLEVRLQASLHQTSAATDFTSLVHLEQIIGSGISNVVM